MGDIDRIVFEKQANKFVKYVHALDGNDTPLNFVDGKGVLVKEEGYKARIANECRQILNAKEWDESWIGKGEIANRIVSVSNKCANLVNFNTIIDFKNHFDRKSSAYDSESEQVIYEIYKRDNDKLAFEHALKVFGAKYSTIAYLFFVKDENRYLPASPENFDRAFRALNIDFKMSHKCSWDNYIEFVSLINEIRKEMPNYMSLAHEVRLLDAHSFVWIVGEKKFIDWNDGSADDINVPISPKSIIRGADGTIRYVCSRCDYAFIKAIRCPGCGQAVKE